MNRKYTLLILIGLIWSVSLTAQMITLGYTQAPPLVVNAGNDATLVSGHSVTLGGNPSAVDGNGSYLYLWTPAAGLDDPTKANPKASPVVTTNYVLTVTDAKNCSVQDDVTVTVQTSGIDQTAESVELLAYPNPSHGNIHLEMNGTSGQVMLRIINSTGVVVHQVCRDANQYLSEDIDTRQFPRGCYHIIAIYDRKVITRPIIIL